MTTCKRCHVNNCAHILNGKKRALSFTREYQQSARANVKTESLQAAGRAGFMALVKKGKGDIASQKAAEWRRNNPSGLEQIVIAWLDELAIPYDREQKIDRYYADFVCGSIVIEVNGAQWHEREELRTGQKERDQRKYETLAGLGYTVIVLPERDIKSGKAYRLLKRTLNND